MCRQGPHSITVPAIRQGPEMHGSPALPAYFLPPAEQRGKAPARPPHFKLSPEPTAGAGGAGEDTAPPTVRQGRSRKRSRSRPEDSRSASPAPSGSPQQRRGRRSDPSAPFVLLFMRVSWLPASTFSALPPPARQFSAKVCPQKVREEISAGSMISAVRNWRVA